MTILYEDHDLLVCLKPAGLLSQPKAGGGEASMLSCLADYLAPQGATPYPVHRLDRQTGGLMVFAKNRAAAAALSAAAAGDGMQKEYLAVVEGDPVAAGYPAEGRLCDLLYFDRQRDKAYVVARARRGVHEARLGYAVTGHYPGGADCPLPLSLLRIRLETGRTHQIRAQFAARKLPLFGDGRYGAKTRGGLGLFAASLSFFHPQSGKRLTYTASPAALFPFSLFKKDG